MTCFIKLEHNTIFKSYKMILTLIVPFCFHLMNLYIFQCCGAEIIFFKLRLQNLPVLHLFNYIYDSGSATLQYPTLFNQIDQGGLFKCGSEWIRNTSIFTVGL